MTAAVRQLRDAVRGCAVGEEYEWQVVRPVRAAFVGGNTHSSERALTVIANNSKKLD